MKQVHITGTRQNNQKLKLMNLKLEQDHKYWNLYSAINEFKKGYQPVGDHNELRMLWEGDKECIQNFNVKFI